MRFTYNNQTYRINFQHGNEVRNFPGVGDVNQDFTVVTIRKGDTNTEDDSNLIATATVRRLYSDTPNNEVARKEAIKKALNTMNADLDFRTAIWTGYHTRPGGLLAKAKTMTA